MNSTKWGGGGPPPHRTSVSCRFLYGSEVTIATNLNCPQNKHSDLYWYSHTVSAPRVPRERLEPSTKAKTLVRHTVSL